MFKSAGNIWLKEHFKLKQYQLSHLSYIGKYDKMELSSNGSVTRIFGPKYAPKNDSVIEHIEFALKYDDIHLGLLANVFQKIPQKELIDYITISGKGKYSRKIGYLYEFLTKKDLQLKNEISGNYLDLLEVEKYSTGDSVKIPKWKINDNLLGNNDYCPVVRRTKILDELLAIDISLQINLLENKYSPQVFKRAAGFLYNKETRSSFEIESETPSPDRMERFIALLQQAGTKSSHELLSEENLTQYQNIIVDPRFANTGFRDFQNYIGENLPNYGEKIHYICPSPQAVKYLMNGLQHCLLKTNASAALVRASLVSFGFVFIHPFEDGNGRLHRFLIHDMLVRDGLVPNGLIIPVSAHILNNKKEYDNILEKYSNPILQHIEYTKNAAGEITVTNDSEISYYYKYPDLTEQCAFLAKTVIDSIKEDMPTELNFIKSYDELKEEIIKSIDMPDKLLNQLILFLHQNNGLLAKRRRKEFSKLLDSEINLIEKLYKEIFEIQ